MPLENLSGNNSLYGTVTMTACTTVNVVGAGDSLILGGVISGGATSDLIKVGPGTLGLGATNTYAGDTLIQAGTLKMINQPMPSAPVAGALYWLDAANASKVVTSGSSVTSWLDSTANGLNFTQGTAANQPTYVAGAINGLPVIRFDGLTAPNTDRLVLGSAVNAQSVFIVNRPDWHRSMAWTGSGALPTDTGIRAGSTTSWPNPGNGNDFSNPGGSVMYINGVAGNSFAANTAHLLEVVRSSAMAMSSHGPGGLLHLFGSAGSR